MRENEISALFDRIVPREKAVEDTRRILSVDFRRGTVEIRKGMEMYIPEDCDIDVVTRGASQVYHGRSCSFVVELAIGGVIDSSDGLIDSKYCFATLYYTLGGDLVKYEFYDTKRALGFD